MAEKKQEARYALKANDGSTVWVPESQVETFRQGQEKLKAGELPPDFEKQKSELLSLLLGQKR